MAAAILVLISIATMLHIVHGGGRGGGWSSAHATFYGGADASGTMGTLI